MSRVFFADDDRRGGESGGRETGGLLLPAMVPGGRLSLLLQQGGWSEVMVWIKGHSVEFIWRSKVIVWSLLGDQSQRGEFALWSDGGHKFLNFLNSLLFMHGGMQHDGIMGRDKAFS